MIQVLPMPEQNVDHKNSIISITSINETLSCKTEMRIEHNITLIIKMSKLKIKMITFVISIMEPALPYILAWKPLFKSDIISVYNCKVQ